MTNLARFVAVAAILTVFMTSSASHAQTPALTAEETQSLTVESANEIAMHLRESGQTADARAYAQWAVETAPENADAWGTLAMVLWDMGQNDSAVECADRALALAPPQPFALDVRAGEALQAGRPAEALVYARRLVAALPEWQEAYWLRGMAYFNLEQYAMALSDFQRGYQLAPENDRLLHEVGVALAQLGKHKQSLEVFDRVLEMNPRSASTMAERANLLALMDRPDEAVDQYRQAAAADAQVAQERAIPPLLAMVERADQRRRPEAQESAEVAVAREYTNRAKAAFDHGNLIEARGLLAKALDAEYDFASAHFVLGHIALSEEDYVAAAVDFEYAMELDPQNDVYAGSAGYANFQADLLEDALDCANLAVALAPDAVAHRELRARVLCNLERYDEMLEDCSIVVAEQPGNASMRTCLAWALLKTGQIAAAREHAELAVEAEPNQADMLHTRGEIYRALGQYDRALRDFQRAVAINPEIDYIRESLEATMLEVAETTSTPEPDRWNGIEDTGPQDYSMPLEFQTYLETARPIGNAWGESDGPTFADAARQIVAERHQRQADASVETSDVEIGEVTLRSHDKRTGSQHAVVFEVWAEVATNEVEEFERLRQEHAEALVDAHSEVLRNREARGTADAGFRPLCENLKERTNRALGHPYVRNIRAENVRISREN